jgi:hypothetical protein
MLIFSVPTDEPVGRCKINKKPCDYRIEGRTFAYRPVDSPDAAWDRRSIEATRPNDVPGQTYYICGPATSPAAGGGAAEHPFSVGKAPEAWRPDHETLRRVVVECQPLLAELWQGHMDDDDVLVLGDIRRPEVGEMAARMGEIRQVAASDRPSWFAYLQPAGFIEVLGADGDFAHREAAKELRGFARAGRAVPLLVTYPGGLWATCWSPEDNVLIHRFEPETPPEAN